MKQHLFWQANGMMVAIAALTGKRGDDWAAYIGGTSFNWQFRTEQELVDWVEANGCKISKSMAEFLFPEFAVQFEYRE
jgi:hypothetical protein